MAASKKRTVSKDDLRRLMKETKVNAGNLTRKVDHPLAKYNKLGQLVCSLCNIAIKSSLLWPAHIQGRQHKEMLAAPKPSINNNLQQMNLLKRKASENLNDSNCHKKHKEEEKDPAVKSNLTKSPTQTSQSDPSAWHKQLAATCSEESSSEDEAGKETDVNGHPPVENETPSSSEVTSKADLPADFFDAPNGVTKENASTVDKKISEVLPEGFFDDPIMDAKVRQVEYKDKMEEEWELFQKQMKEASHVSEAIMEEDDEQANVDRNIDEIDEQIHRWSQINELQNKKEEIMKAKSQKNNDDSDSDDSTALDDFRDLLDWRSKKSWT
ncbi:ZNF830 [Acanthosepion pharaonis]|uniref:Zinc finger protein 830 n=1 Tax=Acanthosepion pharaonis TaxID=158019 RepID=A0A812BN65_ACAPH|nr:ZNF830 [Sepia pharaonis]